MGSLSHATLAHVVLTRVVQARAAASMHDVSMLCYDVSMQRTDLLLLVLQHHAIANDMQH